MSKVSKWRKCPAVSREIKAAECGENRNSEYRCPPDCPFNPFALVNFEQFKEAELKAIAAGMDLYQAEFQMRPWLFSKFQNAMEKDDVRATELTFYSIFVERDAEGKTLAERFADQGFPGLKNDARVVFRSFMATRPSLLEVREVVAGVGVRVADWWNPEAGVFFVPSEVQAAHAVRFEVLMTHTYSLPGFRRLHGGVFRVADFGLWEPVDILEAAIQHAGGPPPGENRHAWLLGQTTDVFDTLADSALANLKKFSPPGAPSAAPLNRKRVAPILESIAPAPDFDPSAFIDTASPALNNLTPREAATRPDLRPKLVRWLKQQVSALDLENLDFGENESIDWIGKELGLQELDCPAPPEREIPSSKADARPFDADDSSVLPPAPRLPAEPLSVAEVTRRLFQIDAQFQNPDAHLAALYRSCATVADDVRVTFGDLFNDAEFSLILALASKATFVLSPPEFKTPATDLNAIAIEMTQLVQQITQSDAGLLIGPARQPHLMAVLSNAILATQSTDPGAIRDVSVILMLAFLRTHLDELDAQLRDA